MYPAVGRVLIRFSRAAVLDAGVCMLCAGAAAGRSGAAAGDAGIALNGFMYPAIRRALSRLSGAATLDAGILAPIHKMQAVSVTSIAQRMLFQIVFFMVKSFLSCTVVW